MPDIDELVIRIDSESKSAVGGVQTLIDTLERLKSATSGLGLNNVSKGLKDVTNATRSATQANNAHEKSTVKMVATMAAAYATIKKGAKLIMSAINTSADYTENVNLFTVSMGEYAEEAKEYAEQVSEIMGIDPGEWMRNQGVFMTLATGFGVVSDRAYTMSKNLTQLGYDISSFFNLPFEDAMEKLQSGLAGELEPLRRIGYDLSQARLQLEAYNLGIDKKVSKMTQAEKAELRYYAIMTQVTTAHGDMARTLNAPANQLRILKSQFVQLSRAIGNIFIPALNAILPYAIAVVEALQVIAQAIADLFGFELTTVDYSGIGNLASGAEDVAGSLGDAADNAKKLKKNTLGFDELNVLEQKDSGGQSISGGSGFDFELPEYNFLSEAIDTRVKEISEKLKPALEDILQIVGSIGAGVVAWNFVNMTSNLVDIIKNGGLNKATLGISILVTGITFGLMSGYDLGYEGATWDNIIKTALADALMIAGALITFGTGPLGWTIGIATALAVTITSVAIGMHDKAVAEDLASRFGDIELTDEQRNSLIKSLTSSETSIKITTYMDSKAEERNLREQVEECVNKINELNLNVLCGVEVSQEEYKIAVDTFISSAQEYLEQRQLTIGVAIDNFIGGTETGDNLVGDVNRLFTTKQAELSNLGTQLKNVVATGFVDGEWIPDKYQEAIDLQNEINEIMKYLSDVEYEAKIINLKGKLDGVELDEKEFKKMLNEASTLISEQVANNETMKIDSLKAVVMQFDANIEAGMLEEEAQGIRDAAIADIEYAFSQSNLELSFGTFTFGMDAIKDAYSPELTKIEEMLSADMKEVFMSGIMPLSPEDYNQNINDTLMQLKSSYEGGFRNADIPSVARENMAALLAELKPTVENMEETARTARELGETVTTEVSKGLHDVNSIKALNGDMRAISYLVGEGWAKDQSFYDALAINKNMGRDIDDAVREGILNNTQIIIDEGKNTITFLNDAMGEKVMEVTPELVNNLKDMGVNISEGLYNGVSESVKEQDYKSIWSRVGDWFVNLFRIHSPSLVFEEYGGYIATGLFEGVDGGITEDTYKTIFGRLSSALTSVKADIVDVINSILGFIEKMVNGVIGGINSMITKLNSLSIDTPDWVEETFGVGNLGFNIPKLQTITIPRITLMAQGGFPETGQMFIAREAGAEMVGSIGRRTAVANNDQIVSGIASGVASANTESNALLREQNSLLRAMLEKDTNISLDGKTISKSVDKHRKERGVTLVTGGAY